MKITIVLALFLFLTTSAYGQIQPPITAIPTITDFNLHQPGSSPTSQNGDDIRIGHDDLVDVSVFEIPELSSTARVSAAGTLVLPYVGGIEAAGRTPLELGHVIEDALRAKYVNDPHVTVFIREYASQPISIIGAVKMPGIYQIKGQKRLLDVLAMAQGLSETAGKTIHIIRSGTTLGEPTLPPPPATMPETGGNSVSPQPIQTGTSVRSTQYISSGLPDNPATKTIIVDAADLLQGGNAALNIPIYAGDVVNVQNAGSIFVVGEFQRPGESILRYGRPVTVAQAIALGGGLTKEAKKSQAFIIRPHSDGTKEQIPVNVAKVLDGSQADTQLMANDVLFIPSNKVKTGFSKALDSAVAIVIGRAIYSGF